MSNKSSLEKRVQKTPEEVLNEIKMKEESTRQRKFVKDILYPFLKKYSKSRSDSKMMLKATLIGLQQAFQNKMTDFQKELSESSVGSLKMEQYLQKGVEGERFGKLLELFKKEKISTTSALLEGMENTITGLEREESSKTNIDSLESVLLD